MPPEWPIRLTPPPETVGSLLVHLRRAHGLDQKDVAPALGKKAGAYGTIERDERAPTRDELAALEAFFLERQTRSRSRLPADAVISPGLLWETFRRHRAWQEEQESFAVPVLVVAEEPGLYDAVKVLVTLDDGLPEATRLLEQFRQGALTSEDQAILALLRQRNLPREEKLAAVSLWIEAEERREPSDSE